MIRRVLSWLLAVTLALGMMPTAAFAQEPEETRPEEMVAEATAETSVETDAEEPAESTEETVAETTGETAAETTAPEEVEEILPLMGENMAFSEPESAVSVTVKLTAQKGNTFLSPPYLSLEASSDLSDRYGFADAVTGGVSALDALIAAHARRFGDSFTADTAEEYLAVDETGAVTRLFGIAAPYGTGLAVNHEANEADAGELMLSEGSFATFFCYSSSGREEKVGKFTAFNGGTHVESAAYANQWDYGIYTFCGDTGTNGLQLALVDAATGALTPIQDEITRQNGSNSGYAALRFDRLGTYLITAYAPGGGVVMPLMTFRSAKTPYIESLTLTSRVQITPEFSQPWDGQSVSGNALKALPDTVTMLTALPKLPDGSSILFANFTYDGVTYPIRYSNGTMFTSASKMFKPDQGVLKIKFGPQIYRIDMPQYPTLKALDMAGLTEAFSPTTLSYHGFVSEDAQTLSITPTANKVVYSVSVNGQRVDSGKQYDLPLSWQEDGTMTVTVTLTYNTPGYIPGTYTITLHKKSTSATPEFLRQPESASYSAGDAADALTVLANASGTVTYQWYKNTRLSTLGAIAIDGATQPSYIPDVSENGKVYYYFCRVTNRVEEQTCSADSQIASVAVAVDPNPRIHITTQIPPIGEEDFPEKHGFVYAYGQTGGTLQAECRADLEGGEWSNGRWVRVMGNQETNLTANADGSCTIDTTLVTEKTGCYYQYRGNYTLHGSTYEGIASESVFVCVMLTDASQVPVPVFITQPPAKDQYLQGEKIEFNTSAAARVEVGSISYQWYVNDTNGYDGAEALTGQNSSQMKPDTDVPGVYYYFCRATNTLQGYTAAANSNIYQVTVLEQVEEKEHPLTMLGSGTEDDPYLIQNAGHYREIYDAVAAGDFFTGKYLRQEGNITLPQDWKPIGSDTYHRFQGNLDGNGYTITIPEGGLPLLGYVQAASVKNLNIYGSKIAGYGLVNNFEGVGFSGSAIVIDNVTLVSGSATLKSGLIGANIVTNMYAGVSNGFVATIRNCTIEAGVVIGYNRDQTMIGSIAGRMQGTVENCVSEATVYGVGYVGGIIGTRDNAMGNCAVTGCTFEGSVVASGDHAGGIVGGGYENSTAPNGVRATINNNTVTGSVTGRDKVGGIVGGDSYVAQAWNSYSIRGNCFTGTVHSDGSYVGGIIGYYHSLNKMDDIGDNTYAPDCGASRGIGYVRYVDTSCETHEIDSGAIYFNTALGVEGLPSVLGCAWKKNHNRTDDPLGADARKLCRTLDTQIPAAPTCYEIKAGGTYQTTYTVGQSLDLSGIRLTAYWTDKTTTQLSLSDVTVSGYNKNQEGTQTVTLTYGTVKTEITVTVKPKSTTITVSVTIMGDSRHSDPTGKGGPHGLTMGGLTLWASEESLQADANETVWDVLKRLADRHGLTIQAKYSDKYNSYYIEGVNGLAEFDNGSNSGWMYTVNGTHPEVGVSAKYVKNGDKIVLHYTDDYSYEEGGIYYGKPTASSVDGLIADIGTVAYTTECKQKIDAARKAYNSLGAQEQKKVTKLSLLEAAEKQYAQLKQADDEARAKNAESLIDKIGTVTQTSGAAISAARKAYDGLTQEQKELVTNYARLTAAETAYAKLTATEDDKARAGQVAELIGKLGTITLDSQLAVAKAREAYNALTDTQKQLVENYALLEQAEAQITRLTAANSAREIYRITGDYIENLGTPGIGSVGGEWMVIGLARSGREVAEEYYDCALRYVRENIDENQRLHRAKSTDNSRMILALTAIGKDAADVDGHNLLLGLSDMDFVKKQGNNGPIWALIALDSGNYPAPQGNVTRQALIEEILRVQTSDGGWAISGDEADSDMTGMALQALAPYYTSREAVRSAVDKAVARLSRMQNDDGGFSTFSGNGKVATSESTAQVIVALAALGIDPGTDERFVKNGCSAVDALLAYAVPGGGFRHIAEGELDGMATEQGYYALTAYIRFLAGQTALYDMTDVVDMGGDVEEAAPAPTEPADSGEEMQEAQQVFPWAVAVPALLLGFAGGMAAAAAGMLLYRKKQKS